MSGISQPDRCRRWWGRADGEAMYASLLGEFRLGQQITFVHDGRPCLVYGILEDGELAYVEDRALRGRPMQPHLAAQLQRVVG